MLIELLSVDLDRVAKLVAKYDDLPLSAVNASVTARAERLNISIVVHDVPRNDADIWLA